MIYFVQSIYRSASFSDLSCTNQCAANKIQRIMNGMEINAEIKWDLWDSHPKIIVNLVMDGSIEIIDTRISNISWNKML
uniref:Uncharacterized protein n=1 Tax=Onchocerca volvulus TaxID=6282 RepID=A0A8R1XUV8_ONCVO